MFPGLCLLALLFAAPPSHRDWAAHPAIVERAAPETIYALGDVHGDSERMLKLLAAATIIPNEKEIRWNAGKSVLVVTGDMIDKGPHSVEVLRILRSLQSDAPKAGGQVILLSGNHEAEFSASPDGKKTADFAADLKKAGATDLVPFLSDLPYGAKVGDWFFSHGGNTAGKSIPQLSATIMKEGATYLTAPDSLLEARLGEGKEQWITSPDEHALLESYAKALGVKHMVQGHQHNEIKFADGTTRKAGQLFCYRGLLCLIDVGMSREVDDSQGAILKITGLQIEAIYPEAPFVRPL